MLNNTNFLNMGLLNIEPLSETFMHSISQVLLTPVIILLIIFFIYSILSVGILIAEYYKRRKMGIGSQDNKVLILEIKKTFINSTSDNILKNIRHVLINSKIISSSKKALISIYENNNLDFETQKSIAKEIVEDEEFKLFKKLEKTDIISKIAPALGLMGTLIPLGPGLLALGSGDTQTLADSLIIAFDTTVLGMAVASLTYVISKIRRKWYLKDIDTLDNLAEYILECLKC